MRVVARRCSGSISTVPAAVPPTTATTTRMPLTSSVLSATGSRLIGAYEAGEITSVNGQMQLLDWTGIFNVFTVPSA